MSTVIVSLLVMAILAGAVHDTVRLLVPRGSRRARRAGGHTAPSVEGHDRDRCSRAPEHLVSHRADVRTDQGRTAPAAHDDQ